jgi:hypothetical protein
MSLADFSLFYKHSDVGNSNTKISGLMLKLFKLAFSSVMLFPEESNSIQPFFATIVTSSLKHATEAKDPSNYLQVLRSMFRPIAHGKPDVFYRDFVPLLGGLLEQLGRMQRSPHSQMVRDLCTELSLTLPVRLIAQLPYMRQLAHSLLLGMQSSNTELIVTCLKLMEQWIDNFSAKFLDPVLADVKVPLLQALWRHRTQQTLSTQVLKLFGKLSGRGREFIQAPPSIANSKEANVEPGMVLALQFLNQPHAIPINIDRAIDICKKRLKDTEQVRRRRRRDGSRMHTHLPFLSTQHNSV